MAKVFFARVTNKEFCIQIRFSILKKYNPSLILKTLLFLTLIFLFNCTPHSKNITNKTSFSTSTKWKTITLHFPYFYQETYDPYILEVYDNDSLIGNLAYLDSLTWKTNADTLKIQFAELEHTKRTSQFILPYSEDNLYQLQVVMDQKITSYVVKPLSQNTMNAYFYIAKQNKISPSITYDPVVCRMNLNIYSAIVLGGTAGGAFRALMGALTSKNLSVTEGALSGFILTALSAPIVLSPCYTYYLLKKTS